MVNSLTEITLILINDFMRNLLYSFLTIVCLVLSGCTYIIEHIPGIYALDIQQGNIYDQEVVDQLRPNMNKRQVLYIMGSPMLRDVFHQNRWDYIYSEQPGGEARVQKHLSIYFKGDVLIGIQGDFRPSSVPVLRATNDVTVDVPERVVEKTMTDIIIDMIVPGDEPPEVQDTEFDDHVSVSTDSESEAGGSGY